MVRIVGINIPDNKKVEISLSYIYGVGRPLAKTMIKELGIDANKTAKDLTSTEIGKLQEYMDKKLKIEGELRRFIKQNINLLKDIQSYRGTRHMRRLPVRGQRTKTNSRTARGAGRVRKTMGSGKRKVDLK